MVEVNKDETLSRYQNILKLQVSMKESSLVELAEKEASGADRFPFGRKLFRRRLRADLLKILNQIDGLGYFQREKIGLIEQRTEAMDSADRLYR
jgi:hypothetical protein